MSYEKITDAEVQFGEYRLEIDLKHDYDRPYVRLRLYHEYTETRETSDLIGTSVEEVERCDRLAGSVGQGDSIEECFTTAEGELLNSMESNIEDQIEKQEIAEAFDERVENIDTDRIEDLADRLVDLQDD